jgi:hypothetical protein
MGSALKFMNDEINDAIRGVKINILSYSFRDYCESAAEMYV